MNLTPEDFTNTFILWLSGAAKMKNAKEIEFSSVDELTTIEFPDNTPTKAIVREYRGSTLDLYSEYSDGQRNGKWIWYGDYGIHCETNYKDGQPDGKWIWYNEVGKVRQIQHWNRGILESVTNESTKDST